MIHLNGKTDWKNTSETQENVGAHCFSLLKLISSLYWKFYNKGAVKGSLLTLLSRHNILLCFLFSLRWESARQHLLNLKPICFIVKTQTNNTHSWFWSTTKASQQGLLCNNGYVNKQPALNKNTITREKSKCFA